MARKKKPPFETAVSTLAALSKDELHALRRLISERIEDYDEIQKAAQEVRQSGNTVSIPSKHGGGGWRDLKMIHGWGPYEYWRWREFDPGKGKVVRKSLYIGKVKTDT